LFSNLSVLDNVIIGMHHKQRSHWYHAIFRNRVAQKELRKAARKAIELLEFFSQELVEDRYKKAIELSQAHRRRLEICRSLINSPYFIMPDEPFSGVDPISVSSLQELIRKLRDRGIGILLTDHSVRETLEVVDRAYLIYEGRVEVSGDSRELVNNPRARQVYLGGVHLLTLDDCHAPEISAVILEYCGKPGLHPSTVQRYTADSNPSGL